MADFIIGIERTEQNRYFKMIMFKNIVGFECVLEKSKPNNSAYKMIYLIFKEKL